MPRRSGPLAIAPLLLVMGACGPAAVQPVTPGDVDGDGGDGAPLVLDTATATGEPVEPPAQGRTTVEALIEDLVRGFQHGNMQELLSLFPPEAVMAEALVCPNANMLAEEVEHNQQDLAEALAELSNVTIELVGIAPRKGKTSTFAAGAYVEDGCTAGAALTLREVVVTVRITEAGVVKEETDDFLVLQLGGAGPWYLLGPD